MATASVSQLAERIKRLLTQRNGNGLRRLLLRYNFADIAEVMENDLSPEELVTCFQFLDMGQASQVLTSLSQDKQILCLSSLPTLMSSQILRSMPSDDAVDILQELDTDQIKKILGEMPFDTETRTIHHLMMEAPDTAAGVMATDFIQVNIDQTVGDALERIRAAAEKNFIYYCYVTDAQGKLLGVVSLKQLIMHSPERPLQEMTKFDIKTIPMTADQEAVANLFRKYYNLLAMPVVDEADVIRGIITLDDIVDIIDEETSEDIYLASGINIEEIDEKNLLTGPVVNAVKARMPWLLVTLFGQLFAATVLASFQETIAAAAVAVTFMPLLSGLSGNMGTQSETITVRGLALNLVNAGNIGDKIRRELQIALITGSSFGTCVGTVSFLMYHNWILSLLLFTAIIVSLCGSAFLGMFIPYAYQKYFRQDPAGVGGPLLTTLLDILTFTTYVYVISLLIQYMP